MRGDKRKARRHRMRHEAWLVLESGERCECALSDISHIGARVNTPDSDVIPDNFMLFLAENGAARRRYRDLAQTARAWREIRNVARRSHSRGGDAEISRQRCIET